MSDELTQFFAKKANKNKDKKKKKSGIISIEDVGNRLERRAKIEDLNELEDQDQDLMQLTKMAVEKNKLNNQGNADDSEWINFNDRPTLEEYGFKEFIEQDEFDSNDEQDAKEPAKTWDTSILNKNTTNVTEEIAVETLLKTPSKYVPPSAKMQVKIIPDINNEEMFPSIDNAEKIEKREREIAEKKKKAEEQRRIAEEERKKLQPESEVKPRVENDKNKNIISTPPFQKYQIPAANSENRQPISKYAPTPTPQQTPLNQQSKADTDGSWRREDKVMPAKPKDTTSSIQASPTKTTPGKYVPPGRR